MSEQPSLRPLPQISADGATVSASTQNYAGGDLLLACHGGGSVLYGFSAAEVMAACTPPPERLLLGYAQQTRKDRQNSAFAEAIVHALIAVLPALLLMGWLREITDNRPATLTGFVLIMLAVMGRAAWRELRTPGKVWQRTEWLDFSTRTWHARKAYPDGSLPTRNASQPFDTLLLVYFVQYWESDTTHDLALCRADAFKSLSKHADVPHLNLLHQAKTEADCIAFARQLSECWQIPARRFAFDVAAQRNRLFGLDEPPPNQRRRGKRPAA